MKCPKCGSSMTQVLYQDVEIERCTGCAGLWFDAFEHDELKELAGSAVIDSEAEVRTAPVASSKSVACPKCNVSMIQMVVAGQPHISYESCGVCHGVYFDAGEFRDFREETFGEKLRDYFGRARVSDRAS